LVDKAEADAQLCVEELQTAPTPAWDVETLESCERIFLAYVQDGLAEAIPRSAFTDLPIWVFAEYVVRYRDICLFGDRRANLTELPTTRPSLNLIGWTRPMFVCHSSPIEAIFHAIVDDSKLRALDCPFRSVVSLPHAETQPWSGKFYFGIDYRATPFSPWCSGVLYLYRRMDLPTDCPFSPFESRTASRPVASIVVSPADWPMLDSVDSVDIMAQNERSNETYLGYPWRKCEEIHPFRWRRPIVEAIQREIEASLVQPLSLAYLGRLAGCSPFALLRIFRAEVGLSPHEYQASLRLNRGRSLLRKGMQIAEAAAETGFFDQSHFASSFRKAFGLTPGRYVQAQYFPISEKASTGRIQS